MSKQQHYFSGIPTAPDVAKLREEWPESGMQCGDLIKYDDVEKVIGVKRGTSRWASVTTRWRRLVEVESGRLVIGTRPGVGFVILSEPEKIDLSHNKLRTATRHARRSCEVVARVNRKSLSGEDRTRLDHAYHISSQVLLTAQTASRAQLPNM